MRLRIENGHEQVINDIKFSASDSNLFGTASDDGNYKIWDVRCAKE
jgi:WD40 repeat protein